MTKGRIALLGAAMTSALVLAGIGAKAQPYGAGPDDRVYDNGTETVIVRPDRDYIEKHTVIGRVDGEINPTAYSLSRSVDVADLDLSQPADRREMRNRVYETAVNFATSWTRACRACATMKAVTENACAAPRAMPSAT